MSKIATTYRGKHPIINNKTYTDIGDILKSGKLSGFTGSLEGHNGGVYVQRLESAFRSYFQVKHAIALNSATSALHAACIACGISAGDEVIVTPYSFSSSASCVLMVGAKPVFVDIKDDIFCLDPLKIRPLINAKTKAIIPVHLCGHPADMDTIMQVASYHKLKVIEDCAQAIGAIYKGEYVGLKGECGIFSFNQSKPISTGEGGMLITNDDYIARVVKAVRNHGEVADPALKIVGYNYRMCEIEAAIALEQFQELDKMNAYRIELTSVMTEALNQIEGLTPPVAYPDCKHVFYTYAVKIDQSITGIPRDTFQEQMLEKGIYFGKGYVKPLYLLPIYGYNAGLCPVAERMYRRELMVTDIFRYQLKLKDVREIAKVIKSIIKGD